MLKSSRHLYGAWSSAPGVPVTVEARLAEPHQAYLNLSAELCAAAWR